MPPQLTEKSTFFTWQQADNMRRNIIATIKRRRARRVPPLTIYKTGGGRWALTSRHRKQSAPPPRRSRLKLRLFEV